MISPPIFTQPLPHTLPVLSTQESKVDPIPQISLNSPQPEASTLYNLSTAEFSSYNLSAEEFTSSNLPTSDYTGSSNLPSPISGLFPKGIFGPASSGSDFYDSPIDQPPSSAFPSEASSAAASDSEIPLSSTKATKQTGLLNFFQKVPAEQAYTSWRKRKRENYEKDKEEYERLKRREEVEKDQKKAQRREQNRLAQQRLRSKSKKQLTTELDDVQPNSSVSSFFNFYYSWLGTHNLLGNISTQSWHSNSF